PHHASHTRPTRRSSDLPITHRPAVRSPIDRNVPVLTPPDLDRHVFRDVPLSHLRPYLNEQMVLGKHLGIKGKVEELIKNKDPKRSEEHTSELQSRENLV